VTGRRTFLALVIALVVIHASPAGSADLSSDLDRIRDRIGQVRSQISTVAADRSTIAKEVLAVADALEAAESEIEAASTELDQVTILLDIRTAALDGVRSELSEQLNELAEIQGQRDTANEEAQRWALEAYMGGGTAQPSIAFNASAVSDWSVGVAYLEVLTRHSQSAADRYARLVAKGEAQAESIRDVEGVIADEVSEIQDLGRTIGEMQTDLDRRRSELLATYEEQSVLLDRFDAQIDEFEGELASLAREESAIRAQIAAAAAPKTSTEVTTSSSGFVRPVPGAISSGYGVRIHPITGTKRMHNGVDMNASQGDPIRAVKAGSVILASVKGGYGNTVMIDHGGGMVTLYAHQSRIGVSVGQKVSAGAVIGYIGSTGDSTGPHLHFEVRINGNPVNPSKYL
jgi:murein DD-endopeptidase MepM/ murein hydrolase activator NlpD